MLNFVKLAALSLTLSIGASSIAFGETMGQYIDDATITTKVKAALLADQQLKALEVSVKTNQGAVQLSGNVDTKSQESQAIKIANKVDGVKSVEDLMNVKDAEDKGIRDE